MKYVAENVASMDAEAEQEIIEALGTKPWRLDPTDAVPIQALVLLDQGRSGTYGWS